MLSLPDAFLNRPLAHRGYHGVSKGRPENSAAAIAEACNQGYGVELDVQLAADGVAVVFHDYTLDRTTTETGDVCNRSSRELAQIPLRHGAGTIPLLSEIPSIASLDCPLLIELKDQAAQGGRAANKGLVQAVARSLEGYSGPIALMSFSFEIVRSLARIFPDIPRGLTSERKLPGVEMPTSDVMESRDRLRMEILEQTGASFVSHDFRDLNDPFVKMVKDSGRSVLCWTAKSPEDEAAARRIADNITFEKYAAIAPHLDATPTGTT